MERKILNVDGRAVGWYDAGTATAEDAPVVLWHHGTPNIGEPPEPLFDVARELGVRLIGLDRPGYGGSDDAGPRAVADVASLAAAVADAAGAHRFGVMGHSGGGPHALATAALLPDRLTGVVVIAGIGPLVAPTAGEGSLGTSWWDGMHAAGAAELTAALQGGDALADLLESNEYDPAMFTEKDLEALDGSWRWFQRIAAAGVEHGFAGIVADDVAYVQPWGFRVADVKAPTLVLQGDEDRIVPVHHGRWIASAIPGAEYQERPGDGHLSVMDGAADALRWLGGKS
ncbi:alpha/beta fold hydrolase [Demequina capsici]|uniref:Alpha/beta hydrolase n=1 Tax=Demequina capsici TaxID=3075620 RepID=A0AA96F6C7_9MICO|nr:alpha/beta hydrolase [Demequina sp. OYTSA14]WNM23642.1 alpha/beta hydrolase [Demequina sp. OYTSA14]